MDPERLLRLGAALELRNTPELVRAFGTVSTDGTDLGLLPVDTKVGGWATVPCLGREHLWLISTTVSEQLLYSAAPIQPDDVAASPSRPRSAMRLRIISSDSGGGGTKEIDLGQTVELYSQSLQVDLIGPTGSVEYKGSSDTVASYSGLVFFSRVSCRLMHIEVSRGARSAVLTETVPLLSGTALVHPIPEGATKMTAYVYGASGAPTWRWLRGNDVAGAPRLGNVAWDIDRPRQDIVVPSASYVRIEIDALRDRTFTFVWTIDL